MQGWETIAEGCNHLSAAFPQMKGRAFYALILLCVDYHLPAAHLLIISKDLGSYKILFFFLLFPAAKIKWKKLEVYLIISWYNLHYLNLSLYYQIMNEKPW